MSVRASGAATPARSVATSVADGAASAAVASAVLTGGSAFAPLSGAGAPTSSAATSSGGFAAPDTPYSHYTAGYDRAERDRDAASVGIASEASPERFGEDGDYDHYHDDASSFGARSPRGRASYAGAADDAAKNFKVVIRVRPPLPRELNGDRPFVNAVKVDASERHIIISENLAAIEEGHPPGPYSTHAFTFDHVYDQHCDQKKVYETTAKAVVESSLKGYNATIFAYGQTGTGKTYTMEGFNSAEERGIIPRAIEQIFKHIQHSVSARMRFLVRASYLQIYNEVISDLLKPDRTNLMIREDKKKGVFVEGLSEWVVRSPAEIYGLMERGGAMRATGSTKMNELSSRSHAVFIIIAEQSETTYLDEAGHEMSAEEFHRLVKSRAHGETGLKALEANVRQSFKVGKLNLVDLAGSERVRITGATGQRLEESKKINQSLSALGNVIAALTDPRGRQHIPYRDSKLTRILEDSLGGNCKTTMMAMISPALEAFVESLSTLKFANRAKSIKNEARINEDVDQKSLLRRYERELKRLRAELDERARSVVDQRRLLELEEQKRRAEEDKMAAIRALEARSREFMREKQEKKRLEERIGMLQSQMLMGGAASAANVQDTPAFRSALKEHQEKIRAEYESRLAELERERETIEEEKAQVDRYKQLLLKQRDIMILLTQRLNERDEQIVALQDELDAYDRHQRELEEKLDEKTAALIHLQRMVIEHNASSPVKSPALVEALGDWATMAAAGAAAGKAMAAAAGAAALGLSTPTLGSPPLGHGAATPGGAAGVPAHLLTTTRQYKRYDENGVAAAPGSAGTAGSGASGSSESGSGAATAGNGGSPGAPALLTADEKIAELHRITEAMKTERERFAKELSLARSELEDTQAEKVSLEYLLREKLEKLVQAEIEARLSNGGVAGAATPSAASAGGATPALGANGSRSVSPEVPAGAHAAAAAAVHASVVRQLQTDLQLKTEELQAVRTEQGRAEEESKRLRKRVAQLDADLSAARTGGSGASAAASNSADVRALQERLSVHEKERRAITTIMESKIKRLVDNIASFAGTAPADGGTGAPNAALTREVGALQKLVDASIQALKNAEQEQAQRSASAAAPTPVPATPLRSPPTAGTAAAGGRTPVAAQGPPSTAAPAARSTVAATPQLPPSSAAPAAGRPSSATAGAPAVAVRPSTAATPSVGPTVNLAGTPTAAAAAAATPSRTFGTNLAAVTPGGTMSVDALIAARKEELQRQRAQGGAPPVTPVSGASA